MLELNYYDDMFSDDLQCIFASNAVWFTLWNTEQIKSTYRNPYFLIQIHIFYIQNRSLSSMELITLILPEKHRENKLYLEYQISSRKTLLKKNCKRYISLFEPCDNHLCIYSIVSSTAGNTANHIPKEFYFFPENLISKIVKEIFSCMHIVIIIYLHTALCHQRMEILLCFRGSLKHLWIKKKISEIHTGQWNQITYHNRHTLQRWYIAIIILQPSNRKITAHI